MGYNCNLTVDGWISRIFEKQLSTKKKKKKKKREMKCEKSTEKFMKMGKCFRFVLFPSFIYNLKIEASRI
ncbi:hypothetical protein L2E82_30407 [Cichorium intybus]|uniref:Uncharacterized protein n=1 Tax=Cichorium intybus TaxID=13427 RepID=A0ACB9D0Z7_CICIN|nr:hypothetical protein L2E82_30407 [Cichorium intybus]